MDGVVYSTSQFGLDERFGDGDTSQIGLDLDEELLLDKVAAAGHGVSDGDPQGSVKSMTPWEQDNIIERINETLEATAVNDSANQLERLPLNAESIEYAEAPSTPGLVQEPNLSSAQKALAVDDHLESEDHNSNELMATESKVNALSQSDFHQGDSHATDWPLPKDSNNELLELNGYHVKDAEVGDSIKSMPSEWVGQLDGSNRLENVPNVPSMLSVESQGDKTDETAVSPNSSLVTSDTQYPGRETFPGNVSVSEGYLVDDQASVKTKIHNDAEISEVHACKDPDDPETLHNHVSHEEMSCVGKNVLKPCSSHLNEPDMSSPGHANSVAPNIQSVEGGSHTLETSKRNDTSVEVQGEECHVIDIMQSEKSQTSGVSVFGDVQEDNGKLDEPLDNVISGDIHSKELNNCQNSDLPAPEKLLSVREGLLDKPSDLLLESTPEKEILAGCSGPDVGYTESTVTVESLNSSESFEVARSKKNPESIPDDDDLLSSILVGRKSSVLKMKPTPPAPEVASRKRARSAPQTSALKRKVLMDDTMVLHGDTIRQQLTNTEDIRRIRKKAPCTSSEILMIRIQFLEDEIFNEPIFTGMSAELTSLCCETQDLSKIMVTETDEHHGSSEVAEDVECSVKPNAIEIRNLPTEDKIDGADALCFSPDERMDTQPVEEDTSLANIINAKGVEDTEVVDRNIDDITVVETEAKGRDEDLLEESKFGPLVANGADAQTDCTAPTDNVNTSEVASLETGRCNNCASANGDNINLGVMNEDGVLATDLGCDHWFGEEPVIDSKNSIELGVDMENASLDDGKSLNLQSAMDVDITTGDQPAPEDHGEFEEFTAGNDTEFLNVDDDEVAEDYEDGDGSAEETRLLDNSGWSSRTRAVAKYLQTSFGRESLNESKALALDHLLADKTRKEASRMFFETLVLKTKDYIQVEQLKPLDNHIILKPRAKLLKSEF